MLSSICTERGRVLAEGMCVTSLPHLLELLYGHRLECRVGCQGSRKCNTDGIGGADSSADGINIVRPVSVVEDIDVVVAQNLEVGGQVGDFSWDGCGTEFWKIVAEIIAPVRPVRAVVVAAAGIVRTVSLHIVPVVVRSVTSMELTGLVKVFLEDVVEEAGVLKLIILSIDSLKLSLVGAVLLV